MTPVWPSSCLPAPPRFLSTSSLMMKLPPLAWQQTGKRLPGRTGYQHSTGRWTINSSWQRREKEEKMSAGGLTMAFSALMLWARGKPIDVRMETLSSGGELGSSGVAPMTLSLVEGAESIMEGRLRGSAKSEEYIKQWWGVILHGKKPSLKGVRQHCVNLKPLGKRLPLELTSFLIKTLFFFAFSLGFGCWKYKHSCCSYPLRKQRLPHHFFPKTRMHPNYLPHLSLSALFFFLFKKLP